MTEKTRSVLYLWSALLLCSVLYIALQGKISTGLGNFSLTDRVANSGQAPLKAGRNLMSRLLIISLENDSQQNLAASSKALLGRLLATDNFAFVSNGQQLLQATDRNLVFDYRYLLSDRFDSGGIDPVLLKASFQALVPKTFSQLYAYNKDFLLADPTQEAAYLGSNFLGKGELQRHFGVLFDHSGKSAILLAYLKAEAVLGDASLAVMDGIETIFREVKSNEKQSISLNGPATFAVVSKNIIKSEVSYMTITGTVLIVLLLYFSFRRKRVMLLIAIPVMSAVICATAATMLVYGSIHAITLAFGVTLLGITIDYPIHLISHVRRDESIDHSVRSVWPVIRLGVITTLTGFVLMVFSDMSGLIQLGVFSFVGLLTAALTTRWVLPVLITDTSRLGQYGLISIRHSIRIPQGVKLGFSVALALLLCGFFYQIAGSVTASSLSSLNPVPKEQLARYEALRKDIGLPQAFRYFSIHGNSAEAVLREEERLVASLTSQSTNVKPQDLIHASRYLPSIQRQSGRQQALPDRKQLQALIKSALVGLPFKDNAFEKFITDVQAARAQQPLTIDDMRGTLMGPYLSSLLYMENGEWIGLVFINQTPIGLDVARLLHTQYAMRIFYTDLKRDAEIFFKNYRDTILDKIALVAAVILFVLWSGLRSIRKVIKVVLPVLATILLSIVLIYYLHGPLTVFHMVALILVFGICVDYSLFFNSDWGEQEYRRIFHAVSVSALSTLAVFSLLASSDIVVLKSIGLTVASGTLLAFLLSYFYSTRQV